MVSIILIVLFIGQLLSFFFIVLLNSKLAKFKDLEARQEKIIREMDDAIGVYLMEMKEENDRLIQELKTVKQGHTVKDDIEYMTQQPQEKMKHIQEAVKVDGIPPLLTPDEQISEQKVQMTQLKQVIPLPFATNAYNKQKKQLHSEAVPVTTKASQQQEVPPAVDQAPVAHVTSLEQQIVQMYVAGKSIEEIAKETQKGKTEIELLIKFHA
ncbi:hypothetical protein AAGS61_01150 [Lysinibacillus sp. KU-BSD001]|uniref:DUF6115 domain-containing protein n=1 Tax=Lysinibacillus sp. KU-BSD001 TaxID=3141328 RepID=UPI0036ED8D51